jgi:bla regulator protein blaR1
MGLYVGLAARGPLVWRTGLVALVGPILVVVGALPTQGQSSDDWQTAAGGKMSFEVASVKPSKIPKPPNYPLDAGNAYVPGGRFSVSMPVWTYISFAYKLGPNEQQRQAAIAQFPKGLNTEFIEIEARAGGNPTKDQVRLMMQSLLADRFKLAVHFETKDIAVLALTLVKPGQTGPKLRPHSEGPPCPGSFTPPTPGERPKTGDVFPLQCDATQGWFRPDGTALAGSRNTTMQLLAEAIYSYGGMGGEVDKPVVDRTGLDGKFDFTVEWTGRLSGSPPPGAAAPPPPDPQGTTFLQAVREQLGLKVVPTKAPARMLVVDHIEEPSEN